MKSIVGMHCPPAQNPFLCLQLYCVLNNLQKTLQWLKKQLCPWKVTRWSRSVQVLSTLNSEGLMQPRIRQLGPAVRSGALLSLNEGKKSRVCGWHSVPETLAKSCVRGCLMRFGKEEKKFKLSLRGDARSAGALNRRGRRGERAAKRGRWKYTQSH